MALGIGLGTNKGYVPSEFAPSSISNLQLWYKYNTGITHGGTPDFKISQWDDQTSNANHAVQSTDVDKPKYDNGAVSFESNGKYMNLTSNIVIPANGDFTICFRVLFDGFSSDALIGNSSNDMFRADSNLKFRTKIGGAGAVFFEETSDTLATATYYTIILVRSGGATGTLNMYVDGGAYTKKDWGGGGSGTDADSLTLSNLGASSDDAFNFDGDFKEIALYDKALSSSERDDMFTYLGSV